MTDEEKALAAFAAVAMHGLLVSGYANKGGDVDALDLAEGAFRIAGEMMQSLRVRIPAKEARHVP